MKISAKTPLKLSVVMAVAASAPSMAAIDFDLGFAKAGTHWFPSGLTMNADTYTEMVFCSDPIREVTVSGFMSRPGDNRDPYGWGNTKADVDANLAQVAFSIDLTTGGAKNPSNMTTVEA